MKKSFWIISGLAVAALAVYLITRKNNDNNSGTNNNNNNMNAASTYPNPSAASRGYRNNNPGNIRIGTVSYNGEIIPSGDSAFKQFTSMAYGFRAMFVLIYTYISKYGLNTISSIIGRYAPNNENNTSAYINTVVERSGVAKNKILTAASGADMIKIITAMAFVENGKIPNTSDVLAGFNLQTYFKM